MILKIQDISYLQKNNLLLLKNEMGIVNFYCPNYIFINYINNNKFKILFSTKFKFTSFLAHLKFNILKIKNLFFLKLKLRGLGYRFKKICNNLYRFYFTRTNYIYMHKPKNILLKFRKKRIILISSHKQLLHNLFKNLLLLHPVGPFNRRGFHYPRKILILKKGKKVL